MRLFLDEAGNTGGILDKNEKLNYGTQRHFCLERDLSRGNFLLTISLFVLTSLSQGNIINTELNNDFCGHLHILL